MLAQTAEALSTLWRGDEWVTVRSETREKAEATVIEEAAAVLDTYESGKSHDKLLR